jgi:hypothetical protein
MLKAAVNRCSWRYLARNRTLKIIRPPAVRARLLPCSYVEEMVVEYNMYKWNEVGSILFDQEHGQHGAPQRLNPCELIPWYHERSTRKVISEQPKRTIIQYKSFLSVDGRRNLLATAERTFENTMCLIDVLKEQCSRRDQNCDFLEDSSSLLRSCHVTMMLAHGRDRITNSNAVKAYCN